MTERNPRQCQQPAVNLRRTLTGQADLLRQRGDFGLHDLTGNLLGNRLQAGAGRQRVGRRSIGRRCPRISIRLRRGDDIRGPAIEECAELVGSPLMRRIRFLEKKRGLAASRRPDPEEMDPDPELLSLLHADSEVLVAGEENALRHRTVARQRQHVGNDEGVDALLLSSRIHEPETNLDVGLIGERDVLRRRALRGAVVPVDPQQRQAGQRLGKVLERGNQDLVVEADVGAREPRAAQLLRALREEVARVDKTATRSMDAVLSRTRPARSAHNEGKE